MEFSPVDRHLLKEIIHIAGVEESDVIICNWVVRTDKWKKEKVVFVFTLFNVQFYEKKKGLNLIGITPHKDIKAIALQWQTKMIFDSPKLKITFEDMNCNLLFREVVKYLVKIMKQDELPCVSYEEKYGGKFMDNKNFVTRFKYLILSHGERVGEELLTDLQNIVSKNPKVIDFTERDDLIPYFDEILDCIDFQPSIQCIKIPNMDPHAWGILAKRLGKNKTLKSIVTSDTYDVKFANMVDALRGNKETHLHKFTFINTDFIEEDESIINSLFDLAIIDTVKFDHSFTGKCFNKVLLTLGHTQGFKKTHKITFKGIKKVDAGRVMSMMRWATSISFIDSKVDIVSALKTFPPGIRKLHIEKGFATEPLNYLNIPGKLTSVKFANITWTPQNLAKIITTFCNRKIDKTSGDQQPHTDEKDVPYSLDLSNAIMTEEQWDEFSSMKLEITDPKNDLNAFIWDNNPLSLSIIEMLEKLGHLNTISVSGSLNDAKILSFCEFIAQSKTITSVIVNGGINKFSQSGAITFIHALKSCSKIQRLGIKDHNFGASGADALADLLYSNKNIRFCDLDGNGMSTREVWYSFFEKIIERGPPLEIPWPEEIMQLFDKGVLKQKDVDHLHDCWKTVESGSGDIQGDEGAMDFGKDDDDDQDKNKIDWDIKVEHTELPSAKDVIEQTLKRLSYNNVVYNLRKDLF